MIALGLDGTRAQRADSGSVTSVDAAAAGKFVRVVGRRGTPESSTAGSSTMVGVPLIVFGRTLLGVNERRRLADIPEEAPVKPS